MSESLSHWLNNGSDSLDREPWNSCCHCLRTPMKSSASKSAHIFLSSRRSPAPSKSLISHAGTLTTTRSLISLFELHWAKYHSVLVFQSRIKICKTISYPSTSRGDTATVHFAISHFAVSHLAVSYFAISNYLTIILTPNPIPNHNPIPKP